MLLMELFSFFTNQLVACIFMSFTLMSGIVCQMSLFACLICVLCARCHILCTGCHIVCADVMNCVPDSHIVHQMSHIVCQMLCAMCHEYWFRCRILCSIRQVLCAKYLLFVTRVTYFVKFNVICGRYLLLCARCHIVQISVNLNTFSFITKALQLMQHPNILYRNKGNKVCILFSGSVYQEWTSSFKWLKYLPSRDTLFCLFPVVDIWHNRHFIHIYLWRNSLNNRFMCLLF